MHPTKVSILDKIVPALQETDCVTHGRIYGSWLYDEQSVDMDIAVIVKSDSGVVEPQDYRTLSVLRSSLCKETCQDVDLVPHTEDELTDRSSPLWYPRYNPSLVSGQDLKGALQVSPISLMTDSFSFADLAAYVLHDNRTICRRQLVRSLSIEEGRIFVSKLLHGPGNALTFEACRTKTDYIAPPSDLEGCFDAFDRLYGTNSSSAIGFLRQCKGGIDKEMALMLMNWYENLVNVVLKGDQFREGYQAVCTRLE